MASPCSILSWGVSRLTSGGRACISSSVRCCRGCDRGRQQEGDDDMDAVDEIIAIEQIKRLKASYFRCMDTKDWDGFAKVLAPDAVMDMSSEMRDGTTEGTGITRGNREIAAFVRAA